jgi:hypothetical protein
MPLVESAAQTGKVGQARITARPVSIPSQRPSKPCAVIAPSRTVPPAILPIIMRGFAMAALLTLS